MTDQVADTGNTQNTGDAGATTAQPTATDGSTALTGGAPAASNQQAPDGNATDSVTTEPAQGQGDDGKATGDGKASDQNSDQAAQGAPDKYEFKAPEGVALDDAVVSEFSAVAKELNLSQDAAQKLVEKLAPKIAERQAARQADQMKEFRSQMIDQVVADQEFGGAKLQENLAVAKKALDAFGTPELRTLLEHSGLGDHPEVIRAFYRVGKAISEDGFVPGGVKPPNGGKTDPATKLYGTNGTNS